MSFNTGIAGFARFLRPDILDFTLGDAAEIKPLSTYGVATGSAQLATYLSVLNGLPGIYVNTRGTRVTVFPGTPPVPNFASPAKPWTPSSWQPGVHLIPTPTFPNHLVFTVGNLGGVIFYLDIPVNPMLTMRMAKIAVGALEKNLQEIVDNILRGGRRLDESAVLSINYAVESLSQVSTAFSISMSPAAFYAAGYATTGLLTAIGIAALLKSKTAFG